MSDKLTPAIKEEIYKFCDEMVDGFDFMVSGNYYDDTYTFYLKLIVAPNSELSERVVRYDNTGDILEVEIGIKKLDKSIQLYLLMRGFLNKYHDGRFSTTTVILNDMLVMEMFDKYASLKYDVKPVNTYLLKFLSASFDKKRYTKIKEYIENYGQIKK